MKITLSNDGRPELLTKEYLFLIIVKDSFNPIFKGVVKDAPKVKPKKALTPFTISVKKITNYGEVNIGFNKDIQI